MPDGRGAGLRWGVRASFLRYVAALPDARASVSEGAELTFDDTQLVIFPIDTDASTPSVLAFRGDLRLAGHGGLLFVRLAAPRIQLAGGGSAVLTVDDPHTEDGSGPRLALVTLRMTRTGAGWAGTDVKLTPEGVPVFNHVYDVGAPFDPLEVVTVEPLAR